MFKKTNVENITSSSCIILVSQFLSFDYHIWSCKNSFENARSIIINRLPRMKVRLSPPSLFYHFNSL